jgi:DNA-binding CsgD family transcriptional regulator
VAQTKDVTLDWARVKMAFAHGDHDGCARALEWFTRPDHCRSVILADCAAAAWIVRTALTMDRRDWAVAAVDAAALFAGDNPDVRSLALAAAHARGVLHEDVEALSEAAEGYQDLWARASATEDLGIALSTIDPKAAVKRLEGALALYQSAGADRDMARTRRRLRALGVVKRHWPRRTDPKSGVASLTKTERAVMSLVAKGLTNQQVADRMFISRHTVAFHLRKIFRKLDIGSRIELVFFTQSDSA